MKIFYIFSILNFTACFTHAQDSLKIHQLDEVTIQSQRIVDLERLPKVQGTRLWSGKKNEVINVQNLDANVAERTPRQIFAKVPGVFVYDMDGTGNQMNISTRGLDPHRGWEYNVRKNGVITNSDMYGYPASHFSVPAEAIDRIELIRGTGSLQYGAQFGGMVNYVTKKPDTTRAISFETINSIGSFGMLSTYNAASGKVGKFKYYAYVNKRISDGYRENNRTTFDAEAVTVIYEPTENVALKAEVSRSNYIHQIAGPLTDSMFYANPRQSTRSRNYFNPKIYVPSLHLDWKINERTFLTWTASAVLGHRNSIQFDKPATVTDAIDPITLQYAPRQVDIDNFNSYTSEVRLLHHYSVGQLSSTLAAGIQLIKNDLHRRQLGKGTSGSDFDLSIDESGWGRDLHFKTNNIAIFIENAFQVSSKLTVSPGARIEIGKSDMTGTIKNYDAAEIPNSIQHKFPLLGINADYELTENHNFYGGWSQAYRPVIFKDIIPAATYEVADKNLTDASGYNVEAGYRGSWNKLRWDLSVFAIKYNNRLGTMARTDEDGNFQLFRTNIGNSLTEGLEAYVEYGFDLAANIKVSVFSSTAFFRAKYLTAQVRSGEQNIDISGNKLEGVPDLISRNGISLRGKKYSISALYSYTSQTFADPLNTKNPSPTGAVGVVPEYGILDLNSSIRVSSQLLIRVNFNNVLNNHYFTKRPTFYPGAGVWSSDGRSIGVTVGMQI